MILIIHNTSSTLFPISFQATNKLELSDGSLKLQFLSATAIKIQGWNFKLRPTDEIINLWVLLILRFPHTPKANYYAVMKYGQIVILQPQKYIIEISTVGYYIS